MVKSLSDQILEVANKPVNADVDIENADTGLFEHKSKKVNSGFASDSGSDDEGVDENAHYVEVGKSKLRRDQTAVLQGDAYVGKKGSRADVFDHSVSENGEESDAMSFRSDSEDQELDESLSENENENDSESDGESASGSEIEEAVDVNEEEKRKRLASLVQQETRQSLNKLSQITQRDAAKGLAVLQQAKVFESIIDARIKLQKAVSAANSLPVTKNSWKKFSDSKTTAKMLKSTNSLLEKVYKQLTNFRQKFEENDHISLKKPEKNSGKRSYAELCQSNIKMDEHLREYRKAVLNKWFIKISSTSGNSVMTSGKFKSINQPTDVQVENQLADLPRLIKRTRLNRKNAKPLNFDEDYESGKLTHLQPPKENICDDNNEDQDNIDIPTIQDPRQRVQNGIDSVENPYIFDDEDFYRVLLNDLIDKKIYNSQNAQENGGSGAISIRSTNRVNGKVHTKASKGRKLNYSIQEPIANYEAPTANHYRWSDEQIDEFFAGLLGQKISFDENEEDKNISDEETVDREALEAIKNDDVQIFG